MPFVVIVRSKVVALSVAGLYVTSRVILLVWIQIQKSWIFLTRVAFGSVMTIHLSMVLGMVTVLDWTGPDGKCIMQPTIQVRTDRNESL